MFGVLVIFVGDDVFVGFFFGQNWRQYQLVVVYLGFGIEDGDVIGVFVGVEQVFQYLFGCYIVVDDDEFLFCYFVFFVILQL